MAELGFDDNVDESRIYSTWERASAFLELLKKIVESDFCSDDPNTDVEREAYRVLTLYLDEYQEQSYLLDPWLEQIVVPPLQALRTHAQAAMQDPGVPIASPRLITLCLVIYHIIKTRGYKTIVPFFPHQVEDLAVCLEFIQRLQHNPPKTSPANLWSIRYVLLLWLWLICRIPFDLSNFDSDPTRPGQTASAIETVGRNAMDMSGIERDGAALLLARLYTRQDSCSHFPGFLSWSSEYIKGSPSIFSALCIMQTVAEILKSGGIDHLGSFLPIILELSHVIGNTTLLNSNTVVRRYIVKMTGRVGLRLSPPSRPRSRPSKPTAPPQTLSTNSPQLGNYFHGTTAASQDEGFGSSRDEEVEVPAEVEAIIGGLLESLQDKDTTIRWSTSKALARIAERLPMDFVNQLLDAVIGLFAIHYAEPGSGIEMPPVAEATWHGACLGCAEFARRGLVRGEHTGQLIKWTLKALFFDVRKGAHSVGSSVRDAACYVLWSLARAQNMDELRPFALDLAQALVATSLFDREIHIRRAASAAFQENVGRTGLFPHGIDVLRKTDFYAVSVRKNAFTVAAPQVAEHEEYRPYLIEHLLNATLKHWDASMRVIGAQSLYLICKIDLATLGPEASRRAILMLKSIDPNDVHGALLALAELATAFQEVESTSPDLSKERTKIFQSLADIPEKTLKIHRNDSLLQASCFVIASSVSPNALRQQPDYDGRGLKHLSPTWRTIFNAALEHRNQVVQEAAAKAITALSMLRDCSSDVEREIQTNNWVLQQSLSRLLGSVVYHLHPASSRQAITCLLALVDQSGSAYSTVIESRRNAYDALSTILRDLTPQLDQTLDPPLVARIIRALLKGLEDYTVDERGDVGSWARLTCIKGLGQIVLLFLAESSVEINKWLPSHTYHEIVAGILKQGVERLNNNRVEAGKQLIALLKAPHKSGKEAWVLDAEGLFRDLFVNVQSRDDELEGWQEPAWLYPKAVRLLAIERYRISVLRGLVLSIGSRNESTQKPASEALAAYLHAEVEAGNISLATSIFQSLLHLLKESLSLNSMMLPLLTTFEVLLEAGVAKPWSDSAEGSELLVSLCDNIGRKASRLKNLQRILGTMRVICWLCTIASVSRKSVGHLHEFLAHQFPKVREETAEYFYLILQTNDVPGTDEAEPFLLETDWTSDDFTASAENVVQALSTLAT